MPHLNRVVHIHPASGFCGRSQEWRELVADTPEASVDLHPDILPQVTARPVRVCAEYVQNRLQRLAALETRQVRLPFIRGVPGKFTLSALRLVGDQLLEPDRLPGEDQLSDEEWECSPTFYQHLVGILSSAEVAGILFEDLRTDSRFARWLKSEHAQSLLVLNSTQPRWFLDLEMGETAYWKSFSSKTRYNLRRTCGRLSHTWERVDSPDQVEQFLESAEQVSSKSWQGRRLGNRVSRDEASRNYFQSLAQLGALRCYLLRHEGEPVAFAVGKEWNGRFILEEIGFDQDLAEFSPGTVLMLRVIEDLFQHGSTRVLDFGFGDGDYKRKLGTRQELSESVLLMGTNRYAQLVAHLSGLGRGLETGARTVIRKLGLQARLRKWYRT